MERSDIACQRQPEGQLRGALATVNDTTDPIRAVNASVLFGFLGFFDDHFGGFAAGGS